MAPLDTYLQFILDYAPYFYYIPGSGVDLTFGRGVAAAAFAIDFLCEAYQDKQFEGRKTEIYNKIVSLADWILTQQCTVDTSDAYGGFRSNENSLYFYSVDACRVIPALLKAYELTNTAAYLTAAVLAGKTFLKTMQDKQTYGGFARAVIVPTQEKNNVWQVAADNDCCQKWWYETYSLWNWSVGDLMVEVGCPGWNFIKVCSYGGGMRFLIVDIPKEAIVLSAHLKLTAYSDKSITMVNSKIRGELSPNPATFSTMADYDGRPRTSAVVNWDDIPAWTKDVEYISPNFKSVMQEIVNQHESGDAVVIFWDDHDDRSTHLENCCRVAHAYSGGAKRPKLEVTWKEVVWDDCTWLLQMDIECLYGLIGLKMLAEKYDSESASTYEAMMTKLTAFLRSGFENLWLYYDSSDDEWHRVGLSENEIYDDPFAYGLIGLYDYEGWSLSCEKVYEIINTIPASADYPGYNPNICWAGYIDVLKRKSACDYYDAVTSGILHDIRAAKDKPSLELSVQIINLHYEEFMFWGVKFLDYSYEENKQSIITVSWLALLLLRYKPARGPFISILQKHGENVTLYSIVQSAETVSYGEGISIKAVVRLAMPDELVIEPGYTVTDFIMVYTLIPIRHHDKIQRHGVDYEVGPPQLFRLKGEPVYYRALCRRLVQ